GRPLGPGNRTGAQWRCRLAGKPEVRIAIVDDHLVARLGIEAVLRGQVGFEIVASTGSVDGLADVEPDVVILDLYLTGPGPSVAAVTHLAARYPLLVMSAPSRRAHGLPAGR